MASQGEAVMEYLEAPWRMRYIDKVIGNEELGCIMCTKPAAGDDAGNLVLYRASHNFVMLNMYPYNGGHLMVAPLRHIARLGLLTPAERHEHLDLVSACIEVLEQVFKPAGYNTGLNLGRAAGAGVDQHLHTHIVPRWIGDTNFMPITADTKVVNEALADTYTRLRPVFDKLII
jgi:ATP adenylyltransferase